MLHNFLIKTLVESTLAEDLGHGHDITTRTLIPSDLKITAVMRTRAEGVIAGLPLAQAAFSIIDPTLEIKIHVSDGDKVQAKTDLLSVTGQASSILTAERTALNFLTHLSGIATFTNRYVSETDGTRANVCETRKTLPGLRMVQKYAVRMGGGSNHRFGLDDAILIKDNHVAVAGGIAAALDHAKKGAGHMVRTEIEVDTLEQLNEVIAHGGADVVLLDNMPPETLKKAVAIAQGKIVTEASGGVNLKTVRAIAETGVDYISVGALTHSAPSLDIGLDIDL